MKKVYDADSVVEAHMVVNLLEQAGITGHLEGEYLQSGVGELPAGHSVGVCVNSDDVPAAREVIQQWEASQPRERQQGSVYSQRNPHSTAIFFAGFVSGGFVLWWLYGSPVIKAGVDYNKDGVLDERHIYNSRYVERTEIDRNFDGQIDAIYEMDHNGFIESVQLDNDRDGIFEVKQNYPRFFSD